MEIIEFNKGISEVAKKLKISGKGYRVLSNIGIDGGQEVPHLHYHVFAGEKVGKKWLVRWKEKVKRYFLDYTFDKTERF